MNILLLGRGKTGSLVAEVARQRGHDLRIAGATENTDRAALAADKLQNIDLVIDFTTPHCVVENIEACARAGKSMVVGTTGWYAQLDRIRALVEDHGTGFLYAANFSVGVNLFLDVARTAAAALEHEYSGQIFERHHVHKQDAPSGTALAIQSVIRESGGRNAATSSRKSKDEDIQIVSFREGDVVGMHEIILESAADRIYLCHDAKSRQGFAEGAVRAAEWLGAKKGFYDFKNVWQHL
jgi:4-hydroxy-tetrahydrodipicolinate reductase